MKVCREVFTLDDSSFLSSGGRGAEMVSGTGTPPPLESLYPTRSGP
jgi:hypothetical protein